jgi:hypothetical protein
LALNIVDVCPGLDRPKNMVLNSKVVLEGYYSMAGMLYIINFSNHIPDCKVSIVWVLGEFVNFKD